MTARLTPEAVADLAEAVAWYSDHGPTLEREFLDALGRSLDSIVAHPKSGPVVEVEGGIRRVLVRRFPYCVFYVPEPDGIVVMGVLHGARSPTAWRRRGAG